MQIKFTLLEHDLIGIGICRTTYETNVEVRSYPAISKLREMIEPGVMQELGISGEAAEKDDAFSMTLTVRQASQLGVKVPSGNYTLVVTDKSSITRLPESFRLQGLGE